MKNKYNIGDKVWVVIKNKLQEEVVQGVAVMGGVIYYRFGETISAEYFFKEYPEPSLFATKEEYIKSLE